MRTIARFAVEKRWYVIALWVAFIVGSQALAAAAGGASYKDVFTLPHTQTQTVQNLLKSTGQAAQSGQAGSVVVHARTGTLDPSQAPAGLITKLDGLCAGGYHIASVVSPWNAFSCGANGSAVPVSTPALGGSAAGHNPLISTDNKVAIINVAWQGSQNSIGNFTGVYDNVKKLDSATIQYEFTGPAFANLAGAASPLPEIIGLTAALIILGFVFRAVGPTLLPLLSAVAALGAGLGLISLLSHAMNVAEFTTQLASLMVIGVGVDYALFIVTRHRRNLLKGMTVPDSIALAIDTSGRAVLFAGLTVCIAILGLCALGVTFLYGVAVGTSIAVALTMIASLTLLPAVLSFLGLKVLPKKVRRSLADGSYIDDHHTTRWARWSESVQKNKVFLGVVAAAVIVVLAIPFFSMRLGRADQASDPSSFTTRKGYDLITSAPGFGKGYNSNLELVLSGPSAAQPGYVKTISTDLAAVSNVNPSTIHAIALTNDLSLINFKSISSPQDQKTNDLVNSLRGSFSAAHERGSPNKIYVYGQTAIFIDFAKVLAQKVPLFFAAVIGLSFLLLMVAFRSLVIPLTAAVMNLFAAGASFGIVVAIFQWGWFSDALGIGAGGPIDAFLPVLFFAILFGLSMDYQVFLVSRMHEEWMHTDDNHRAIRTGQAETGGIITVAAVIMIAVFGSFLLGDSRAVKLVGIGLGGAIFIDAFLLRTILVPALMHALGRSNWYFPRWLDRITPRLSVEPADSTDDNAAPRGGKDLGGDKDLVNA
jgi:RND superfamily putative drug exporter